MCEVIPAAVARKFVIKKLGDFFTATLLALHVHFTGVDSTGRSFKTMLQLLVSRSQDVEDLPRVCCAEVRDRAPGVEVALNHLHIELEAFMSCCLRDCSWIAIARFALFLTADAAVEHLARASIKLETLFKNAVGDALNGLAHPYATASKTPRLRVSKHQSSWNKLFRIHQPPALAPVQCEVTRPSADFPIFLDTTTKPGQSLSVGARKSKSPLLSPAEVYNDTRKQAQGLISVKPTPSMLSQAELQKIFASVNKL